MWFFIALLGYFLLAMVLVLDKIILTKNVGRPVVYAFYSTIFMFGAFLVYPFGVQNLMGMDWMIALLSGLSFGFALWTMYLAVIRGEASHIDPFIGGVVTIFTFLLSSFYLEEGLSHLQMVGIVILLFASFLLSFEKTKLHSGFHIGFFWAILSGILFAVSHVSAKYIYNTYDFLSGFVWTRGFVGVVALFALLSPAVWKTFSARKQKNEKVQKIYNQKRKSTIILVIMNKIIGVVAVVCIQFASSIGKTAPVFAMTGIQYALMFFLIYSLTRFYPKTFKEYFTRRELLVETVAIFFIVAGSALFVF